VPILTRRKICGATARGMRTHPWEARLRTHGHALQQGTSEEGLAEKKPSDNREDGEIFLKRRQVLDCISLETDTIHSLASQKKFRIFFKIPLPMAPSDSKSDMIETPLDKCREQIIKLVEQRRFSELRGFFDLWDPLQIAAILSTLSRTGLD